MYFVCYIFVFFNEWEKFNVLLHKILKMHLTDLYMSEVHSYLKITTWLLYSKMSFLYLIIRFTLWSSSNTSSVYAMNLFLLVIF